MDASLPQPYHYQPLEHDRHIRLLRILNPDSDQGCKNPTLDLVHVHIDSAPPYEAVSYVWGDPTPTGTLRLSSPAEIGGAHNLNEAMPYLIEKAASETGCLWIDAICINQADPAEKGRQIPLMGDVYNSASRTLAWLGPELPDDEYTEKHGVASLRALEGMAIFDRYRDTPTFEPFFNANTVDPTQLDVRFRKALRHVMTEESITEERCNALVAALDSILSRPLFTRAWTFQEWALSDTLHILVGHHVFVSKSLFFIPVVLFARRSFQGESARQYARFANRELVRSGYLEHKSSDRKWRFDAAMLCRILTFIHSTDQALTTEPHDRVFAFLGLVDLPGFRPDYSFPMEDTLTSFSHHVISATQSLDIVPSGCGLGQPELAGVPSWVPDWSVHLAFRPLHHNGLITMDVRWDAAKGLKHTTDINFESKKLLVRGRMIDTVAKRSPTYSDMADEDTFLPPRRISWEEFMGGEERIVPWRSMEPVEMFRILMASRAGGHETDQTFWTAEQCVTLCERYIILKDPLNLDAEEARRIPTPTEPDEIADWGKFRATVLAFWASHPMLRTSSGRCGMASNHTEVGDEIFILHGLRVPIVLRKQISTGRYQVVGDTYIEDAMFGEARTWEESEADDIVLV